MHAEEVEATERSRAQRQCAHAILHDQGAQNCHVHQSQIWAAGTAALCKEVEAREQASSCRSSDGDAADTDGAEEITYAGDHGDAERAGALGQGEEQARGK